MRYRFFALLCALLAAAPLLSAQQTVSTYKGMTIYANSQEKIEARVFANGAVEIRYKDIRIFADKIDIDINTKDVLAFGHVTIQLPNETINAEKMTLNLDTRQGTLDRALGRIQPDILYESGSIERKSDNLYAFGKMSFTSCTQPTPRWQFSCARANFKKNDYMEMWGAVFRIKKIPIFFLPYMRYPLDRDRSTGFLMPQAGYNQIKGFSISQGFYWAIARNMDASFSVDYYAAKGVGGGLEYRYIFGDGTTGQANLYYFMFKTPPSGAKPENAYIIRWNHTQALPFGFKFVAAVDSQNSFQFLQEFDNNFRRSLVFNRSSQAYVTKTWNSFSFSARAGRFETSFPVQDASIVTRYLPQINLSGFKMKIFKPLYFSFSSSFTRMDMGWDFWYKNNQQFRNQEFTFSPTLSLPFNAIPWLTVDFSLSGNLTHNSRSVKSTVGVVDEGIWTGNYTFEVSLTGPVLYRIWDLKGEKAAGGGTAGSGRRMKHVVEPFVSYRYESPYLNADRIYTPWGLFRNHQISYGLNNHILVKDEGGAPREILTLGLVQAYFLAPEDSPLKYYRFNGRIPEFTEVQGYLRYYPSGPYSVDLGAYYNVYSKTLAQLRVGANYSDPAGNLVAGINWYKYVNPYYKDIYFSRDQIQFVGSVKIPRWQLEAQGDLSYNIGEKKFLYAGGSLIYHYQCLDIKANLQAFFFRATPELQFKISFGLGNIGKSTEFLGGAEIEK
jgi:LPS-assembly protein